MARCEVCGNDDDPSSADRDLLLRLLCRLRRIDDTVWTAMTASTRRETGVDDVGVATRGWSRRRLAEGT